MTIITLDINLLNERILPKIYVVFGTISTINCFQFFYIFSHISNCVFLQYF